MSESRELGTSQYEISSSFVSSKIMQIFLKGEGTPPPFREEEGVGPSATSDRPASPLRELKGRVQLLAIEERGIVHLR